MSQIKRFEMNTAGRDFAVGDIHGHFTRLQTALDAAGFDPAVDRLFSVGDLVDRGPESLDVDEWVLRKPWFHAVRGNHEQMTVDSHAAGRTSDECGMHFINGGQWFYGLSSVEQGCYASILQDLPLVVEVETTHGLIGIVHADCPYRDWKEFTWGIESGGPQESEHLSAVCMWSRKRISDEDSEGVKNVRAVIVGHTPLRQPAILGNVYHIDTAGWMDGHFTLLNLQTLECIPPVNPKLHWDWDERA
ncbi:metallophosphoesterase [Pseudomonas grimontii]|uniref:metallophosphoesterase n=1 Tax=Pseudomonas grimontii TaxID=129847 RepID=UPI00387B0524